MRKLRLKCVLPLLGLTIVLSACGHQAVPQADTSASVTSWQAATADLVRTVPEGQKRDDFLAALSLLPPEARSNVTLVDLEGKQVYGTSESARMDGLAFYPQTSVQTLGFGDGTSSSSAFVTSDGQPIDMILPNDSAPPDDSFQTLELSDKASLCNDNKDSGPYNRWYKNAGTKDNPINWMEVSLTLPDYNILTNIPDFKKFDYYYKESMIKGFEIHKFVVNDPMVYAGGWSTGDKHSGQPTDATDAGFMANVGSFDKKDRTKFIPSPVKGWSLFIKTNKGGYIFDNKKSENNWSIFSDQISFNDRFKIGSHIKLNFFNYGNILGVYAEGEGVNKYIKKGILVYVSNARWDKNGYGSVYKFMTSIAQAYANTSGNNLSTVLRTPGKLNDVKVDYIKFGHMYLRDKSKSIFNGIFNINPREHSFIDNSSIFDPKKDKQGNIVESEVKIDISPDGKMNYCTNLTKESQDLVNGINNYNNLGFYPTQSDYRNKVKVDGMGNKNALYRNSSIDLSQGYKTDLEIGVPNTEKTHVVNQAYVVSVLGQVDKDVSTYLTFRNRGEPNSTMLLRIYPVGQDPKGIVIAANKADTNQDDKIRLPDPIRPLAPQGYWAKSGEHSPIFGKTPDIWLKPSGSSIKFIDGANLETEYGFNLVGTCPHEPGIRQVDFWALYTSGEVDSFDPRTGQSVDTVNPLYQLPGLRYRKITLEMNCMKDTPQYLVCANVDSNTAYAAALTSSSHTCNLPSTTPDAPIDTTPTPGELDGLDITIDGVIGDPQGATGAFTFINKSDPSTSLTYTLSSPGLNLNPMGGVIGGGQSQAIAVSRACTKIGDSGIFPVIIKGEGVPDKVVNVTVNCHCPTAVATSLKGKATKQVISSDYNCQAPKALAPKPIVPSTMTLTGIVGGDATGTATIANGDVGDDLSTIGGMSVSFAADTMTFNPSGMYLNAGDKQEFTASKSCTTAGTTTQDITVNIDADTHTEKTITATVNCGALPRLEVSGDIKLEGYLGQPVQGSITLTNAPTGSQSFSVIPLDFALDFSHYPLTEKDSVVYDYGPLKSGEERQLIFKTICDSLATRTIPFRIFAEAQKVRLAPIERNITVECQKPDPLVVTNAALDFKQSYNNSNPGTSEIIFHNTMPFTRDVYFADGPASQVNPGVIHVEANSSASATVTGLCNSYSGFVGDVSLNEHFIESYNGQIFNEYRILGKLTCLTPPTTSNGTVVAYTTWEAVGACSYGYYEAVAFGIPATCHKTVSEAAAWANSKLEEARANLKSYYQGYDNGYDKYVLKETGWITPLEGTSYPFTRIDYTLDVNK